MYSKEEAEGRRLKNPFDTITEGIGINRLTANFKLAELDGAFQGTDMQAVEMSRYIHLPGLFLFHCISWLHTAVLISLLKISVESTDT